jgi:hypothetical protein
VTRTPRKGTREKSNQRTIFFFYSVTTPDKCSLFNFCKTAPFRFPKKNLSHCTRIPPLPVETTSTVRQLERVYSVGLHKSRELWEGMKLGSIDIALSVHETHSIRQSQSRSPLARACACQMADSPITSSGKCECVLTCTKVEVVGEDGKTGANSKAR